MSQNFGFLDQHDPQLARLGALAELFFAHDANTCLLKIRQFGELLAQTLAARTGQWVSPEERQIDLLRRLADRKVLPREVADHFHTLRKAGNDANHEFGGEARQALTCLKIARAIGIWFHRCVTRDNSFDPGPFLPPPDPRQESDALRHELERLRAELGTEAARRLEAEQRALEAEAARQALEAQATADQARVAESLVAAQAKAEAAPAVDLKSMVEAGEAAAKGLPLDERETRRIIDAQLRAAGWTVDTESLRHDKGTRPQRGKVALAIAEWPTATGPADYVLFVGETAVGVVEAKRKNKNIQGALTQAARYAKGFQGAALPEEGPWGEYKLPFLFSTNGRPYLRQLETMSGIWFRDARRDQNLPYALEGWPTPKGLEDRLRQDVDAAHAELLATDFTFAFGLRDYQTRAIKAVEAAIAQGQREILVAMATGTGKTKTTIAMVYRLLKANRFRRILFLVDRTALGEQTGGAFTDTRITHASTFSNIYNIKELNEAAVEADTQLHIATVQALVKRILFAEDEATIPPVDQYDCIVIDECHRGYLLDRTMSDDELRFRSEEDYVSKYRRVLDRFDAVKIGLTATPALHTTQIFGPPVFRYTYAEAVIDGFLVDHDPPLRLHTKLSRDGITWETGEDMAVLDTRTGEIDTITLPDEVEFEIEDFNRKVITESFNRVVAGWLARHIDPNLPGKTLVFCASDAHADIVVKALQDALAARYGDIDHRLVQKITGSIDRPLEMIRHYKNENLPKIAVTVDLLTTGIDVPEIVNLVFIRRVNSRILYEQMLGRGTRLCEDLFGPGQDKATFRVFDAVGLYEAMQAVSDMKPVVANVNTSFTKLAEQLVAMVAAKPPGLSEDLEPFQGPGQAVKAEGGRFLLDQFIAKLHRKRRQMSEKGRKTFTDRLGMSPEDFVIHINTGTPEAAAKLFAEHSDLIELLDRDKGDGPRWVALSDHDDEEVGEDTGYGENITRPEDYLDAFKRFIDEQRNLIPALMVIAERPRELTRDQLREVRLLLERAGFDEAHLRAAWRDAKSQDIAASIIGFIRQAAIGDPLVPYDQRVDKAMQRIYTSRAWTAPQRQWLEAIARQMKKEFVVDHAALDRGAFKTQGGGFARLNRVFDGRLDEVLGEINEGIWRDVG